MAIDLTSKIDVTSRMSPAQARKIFVDAEFENGSFRYRVQTKKITVVVAFKKPNHVVIITAWCE